MTGQVSFAPQRAHPDLRDAQRRADAAGERAGTLLYMIIDKESER